MTRRGVATLVAGLVLGAACSGPGASSGTVTVLAAASLTDAFTELADAFEAADPDTEVVTSFAASSELVRQIAEGAPADVFASADEATMDRLVDEVGTDGEPVVFATNRLAIAVEPGNPKGVATLDDLADPDLVFVTAAPEVPIGRYTREVLDRAGVDVTPKSLEESVRGILTKVVLGEADAGIVYETDVVAAADDVDRVAIPAEVNVVARYPVAVPTDAPQAAAGRAFVAFVRSAEGQAILESFGFGPP